MSPRSVFASAPSTSPASAPSAAAPSPSASAPSPSPDSGCTPSPSLPPVLSLAHLTVLDAHPLQLIDAAVAGGFDAVGLRIVPPTAADAIVPVIEDRPLRRELKAKLTESGVQLLDIEAIWLDPQTRVGELEAALETGRELGARHVLVVGNDPDPARVTDRFAKLAELAMPYGLKLGLEFISYCHTSTLAQACAVVRAAAQPNAGVLVDVLHLVRSGGTAADLAGCDIGLLSYCQLCDARGPRPASTEQLRREGQSGRFYPGEGELPLTGILAAMPAGLPISLESPCAEDARLSVVERARRCGAASRAFLEAYRHSVDEAAQGHAQTSASPGPVSR